MDEDLRALERRWRAGRADDDEAALLAQRRRVGELDDARLLAAAAVCHEPAQAAARSAGLEVPPTPEHLGLFDMGDLDPRQRARTPGLYEARIVARTARDGLWLPLGKQVCLLAAVGAARRLFEQPGVPLTKGVVAKLADAAAGVDCSLGRLNERLAQGAKGPIAGQARKALEAIAKLRQQLTGHASGHLGEAAYAAALGLEEAGLGKDARPEVVRAARAAVVAWALGAPHAR